MLCAMLWMHPSHATTSLALTPGTYGSRFVEIQHAWTNPKASYHMTLGVLRSQRSNGRVVNAHTFEFSRRVHLNSRHLIQVGLGHLPRTTLPCVRVKSIDFGRCQEPELEIIQNGTPQAAVALHTSQLNALWAFQPHSQVTLQLQGVWGYSSYDSPAFDITNSFLLSSRTGDTTFGEALDATSATQPKRDRFGFMQIDGIWKDSVQLFDQRINLSAQLSKPLLSVNGGDWTVVQFPVRVEGALHSQITDTIQATYALTVSNMLWDGQPSVFLNPLTYRNNAEPQVGLSLRVYF